MTSDSLLLLVGSDAVALAPRLTASGYLTVDWLASGVASHAVRGGDQPVAAILAADQSAWITDLRQRFDAMPILLDLREDSIAARSACLQSGADDFWLSTVGASDLLLRLRLHRTFARRSVNRPAVLQLDDLRLDPMERQVRRGSRRIDLTAREYDLLLVLMREQGRVLSRDELMQEVWQDEQRASSNVVEVYVRYLRQKLEDNGEHRLLITVRGRGYCLGPERSS